MADRERDHPSQRGVKGFMKRGFSGAEGSFLHDYKAEVRAELATVPREQLAGAWVLQTIMAGTLASLPGVAITLVADKALRADFAAVDTAVQAGQNGPGYQAVRFNGGEGLVLFQNEGRTAVYRLSSQNELTLIDSAAQAAEAIANVRQNLAQSLSALESGRLQGTDVPEIQAFTGLTVPYVDEGGQIERQYAGLRTSDDQNTHLLTSLQTAQAQWDAAARSIATTRYGYTAAEKAAFAKEADAGVSIWGGVMGFVALGALIGFTGPFTVALPRAMRRRRTMKKG